MEQLLDRLNKAPNSLKFGGLIAVVVLLTAGNYFLFVSAEDTAFANARQQRISLDAVLADKLYLAQNLPEKRKEFDKLNADLQEALVHLPQAKDIDKLLADLNDVGRKSGLDISNITPQPESPDTSYVRIPIKMSVSGNYQEIALFLQEVGNMNRIVNVANIHLMGQGSKVGEKVVLNGDFMATTFRFPDAPKAPKK